MTRPAGRGYVVRNAINHSLRSAGRFLVSLSLAPWEEGFIAACASARNDMGGGKDGYAASCFPYSTPALSVLVMYLAGMGLSKW